MDEKRDRAALKKIQTDEAWDVLLTKLQRRIESIALRAIETGGQDSFQELKVLHKSQGGIEELKQFFEDIERNAFED